VSVAAEVARDAAPGVAVAARPGGPGLVLVDVLACALLSLIGAAFVYGIDPAGVSPPVRRAFLALPLTLLGPLGTGLARGRKEPLAVRVLFSAGSAAGALGGLFLLGGHTLAAEHGFLAIALRTAPALVFGPVLAGLGASVARPEEPWRAAARAGPPDATPAFARTIAAFRAPLALRVILFPLGVALAPVALLGLVSIRCYKLAVSRVLPPICRFEPSCSSYGFEAIWRHGFLRGGLLTAFRLGRCHPFCTAGHDPVPPGS
jgi:putative membrane protein insertion efficiency factor